MFAVCIITLCLMAVSHQADVICQHPLRLLDRSVLEGRWALVAGSVSDPADLEKFKLRDSAGGNFANGSEASTMSLTSSLRFNTSCQYQSHNITLDGFSFHLEPLNLTVTALQTSCKDCAVMRFDGEPNKLKLLYLFSRRREVGQKELEEFRDQVKCLNMPDPVLMDPTKDLCPDEVPAKPAVQSEETAAA